jgi:hypothetical protein
LYKNRLAAFVLFLLLGSFDFNLNVQQAQKGIWSGSKKDTFQIIPEI